jgi:BirA family biotin operon repressor/biotin-[acetyl-CoA-carboxylase] ligase
LGLQQLSPQATAPNTLAQVVLPLLKTLLAFEREGFAPWQPRFNAYDALLNRAVTLSDGRAGTARGVDVDGALCVDTAHGRERITSAEVSVRPQCV